MSRISGTAELLRLLILGGDLRPGERIVEVHLARRLGVERPALREALRRLEGEGLLVADDAGGMHVIVVDELQTLADITDPAVAADRNFHRAVAALGGNRLCRDALNHVWDRLVLAEHVPTGHHEHRGIAAAIVAGDEDEASAVARRHVLAGMMLSQRH